MKMSALYALDSFGGGFIVQSLIAYWFYLRFGTGVKELGGDLFRCECRRGNVAAPAWTVRAPCEIPESAPRADIAT